MRTSIISILLATVFVVSCGNPPMPSTDEEMIRNFITHEATFNTICEIIANNSEGSFHYPPLSSGENLILDSAGQISCEPNQEQDIRVHGLSKPDRIRLDFLLAKTGCGFIVVDRQERETADSVSLSLVMPYCIVDAETSKSFVYAPGLRSRRNIHITEEGDLNEIYRRTYNDTTLYKPIKENWYIQLDHSLSALIN